MAIAGVITTQDVLRHSGTIVREFGAGAYMRCCVAILLRKADHFFDVRFRIRLRRVQSQTSRRRATCGGRAEKKGWPQRRWASP